MAEEDYSQCATDLEQIESQIIETLLPKDETDERDVILEIRPGAGGTEAGLFAKEMFYMYERYAENRNWKFDTLSFTENDFGGLRVFNITGYMGLGVTHIF